jgi:hypothetical protein
MHPTITAAKKKLLSTLIMTISPLTDQHELQNIYVIRVKSPVFKESETEYTGLFDPHS